MLINLYCVADYKEHKMRPFEPIWITSSQASRENMEERLKAAVNSFKVSSALQFICSKFFDRNSISGGQNSLVLLFLWIRRIMDLWISF